MVSVLFKRIWKLHKEGLSLSIRHLERVQSVRELIGKLDTKEKDMLIEDGKKYMNEILEKSSLSDDVKKAVIHGMNSAFKPRPDEKIDVV